MNTCDLAPTTQEYLALKTVGVEKLCPARRLMPVERDSGFGLFEASENYSVSRRGSACSSGCPSVCSRLSATPSPNTTTSSAYSSAASSCFENDSRRRKTSDVMPQFCTKSSTNNNVSECSRVPFHPEVTRIPPVTTNYPETRNENLISSCVTRQSRRRSRAVSSSSTKSGQISTEDNRQIFDPISNRMYEKKRLLGKGGFARVYEVVRVDAAAEDMKTSYAAKVIDKSRISRPQQREKVDVEVELLAEARDHPNVVSYLDSFEDENLVVILLELCNKKSLAQHLRKRQYLSEPEVCNIMQQIVSGLSHLHGKGIIHRDLKLGNILLCDDMQVKIGDFGLATRVEWGRKKTICGTPNFIAPEVLQRQGHGPESDIWALGCLLYTLLVGKPPFETSCLKDTYRCILKNSFRIPSTVSTEAADLIRWMLRHRPSSRPSLSEISNHSFFEKHSEYLSLRRPSAAVTTTPVMPTITPPTVCVCDRSLKPSDAITVSSSQLSVDKSLTQICSEAEKSSSGRSEADSDRKCSECPKSKTISANSSRSPVKLLASRLQKRLSKVTSGKCVRAAATSFREGRKGSKSESASLKAVNAESNQNDESQTKQTTSGPKTFISKWVDYSNRYGFGYQLSNGTIGVLFNDGKHISVLRGGKTLEYASHETASSIRFSSDSVPPCLSKFAAILKNFTSYMDKNLSQNTGVASAEKKTPGVRLLTWSRTDDYVVMYLSDGTLQVNFTTDHVKINITALHKRSTMLITLVDAKQNPTTYTRSQFISAVDSEMKRRFSSIHQHFHSIFSDVNCDSHPFCGLCLECGCSM